MHPNAYSWFIFGIYYGYPLCCVKAFCDTGHLRRGKFDENYHPSQVEVANKDGGYFIPCIKCAEKVLSGQCTVQDLISNRFAPKPYPSEEGNIDSWDGWKTLDNPYL